MLNERPFSIGQAVVLRTGYAPQRVVEVTKSGPLWYLRTIYWREQDQVYGTKLRRASDFVPYAGNPDLHNYIDKKATPKMASSPKLYQTLDKDPQFGTFLAKNSLGKIVLEMKPSGVPQAFDPSEIEEVKPYTISARDYNNNAHHYTTSKDRVVIGDIIALTKGGFIIIDGINTGYEGLTVELAGRKVVTEDI